jgi:hypothetical protein
MRNPFNLIRALFVGIEIVRAVWSDELKTSVLSLEPLITQGYCLLGYFGLGPRERANVESAQGIKAE